MILLADYILLNKFFNNPSNLLHFLTQLLYYLQNIKDPRKNYKISDIFLCYTFLSWRFDILCLICMFLHMIVWVYSSLLFRFFFSLSLRNVSENLCIWHFSTLANLQLLLYVYKLSTRTRKKWQHKCMFIYFNFKA